MITENGKQKTVGHWDPNEAGMHINYLELLAAWFTIKCFCRGARDSHIKIMSDNTTTVA